MKRNKNGTENTPARSNGRLWLRCSLCAGILLVVLLLVFFLVLGGKGDKGPAVEPSTPEEKAQLIQAQLDALKERLNEAFLARQRGQLEKFQRLVEEEHRKLLELFPGGE